MQIREVGVELVFLSRLLDSPKATPSEDNHTNTYYKKQNDHYFFSYFFQSVSTATALNSRKKKNGNDRNKITHKREDIFPNELFNKKKRLRIEQKTFYKSFSDR